MQPKTNKTTDEKEKKIEKRKKKECSEDFIRIFLTGQHSQCEIDFPIEQT